MNRPNEMPFPSVHVCTAAIRGLEQHPYDELLEQLLAIEPSPFVTSVRQELDRMDMTRLLWYRTFDLDELEIWKRGKWARMTQADARALLLDRYREVGLHDRVQTWIENHPDTPKEA